MLQAKQWWTYSRKNTHSPCREAKEKALISALRWTKSLQLEWTYLQHIVPNCAIALAPLSDNMFDRFLPAVLGGIISEWRPYSHFQHKWVGYIGAWYPVESVQWAYTTSKDSTCGCQLTVMAVVPPSALSMPWTGMLNAEGTTKCGMHIAALAYREVTKK